MKRSIILLAIMSMVSVSCFADAISSAEELKYSDEVISQIKKIQGEKEPSIECGYLDATESENMSEADAVQEQLTEMARTRNIPSVKLISAEDVRQELLEYWNRTKAENSSAPTYVDPEVSQKLEEIIKTVLNKRGFKIVSMELKPTSRVNVAKGEIKVVRPLKSKNSAYNEIQRSLKEVKRECLRAATFDDVCHLSEMTVFYVINPKNNYYYEKTILRP